MRTAGRDGIVSERQLAHPPPAANVTHVQLARTGVTFAGGGGDEGGKMVAMALTLNLVGDPEADTLLAEDPLALLIGMLLDQQVPMETAFLGPKKLHDRLNGLDVHTIAAMNPEEFAALCAQTPAVHRFPGSMAGRIQALCTFLVETYGGKADGIWTSGDPDGKEVLKRLKALPGYGDQKARIFLALLGKQIGVQPEGWRDAAGAYGDDGARRSIADVVDEKSLLEVREFKKAAKAAAKAAKQ